MILLFLSSGLFLGWSLGANDAANVFGTAVATRMVRFRTAAVVTSVFVILGAVVGGIMSADQVLHYIVPGSGSYGNAIFGLHLYSWALIMFVAIIVGCGVMLLFDRQYEPSGPPPLRQVTLPILAVALLALLAVGNVLSTLAICGVGLCPETPGGYLIFHENLGLALGNAP